MLDILSFPLLHTKQIAFRILTSQFIRLTTNIWAGYSPHLLRERYSPAIRSLLAVDLHVWFSQDEEVFTQQVK